MYGTVSHTKSDINFVDRKYPMQYFENPREFVVQPY